MMLLNLDVWIPWSLRFRRRRDGVSYTWHLYTVRIHVCKELRFCFNFYPLGMNCFKYHDYFLTRCNQNLDIYG